jgi:hypothetical protein
VSELLSDLDLAPERETAREPAKRWRNRYRALEAGWCASNGRPVSAGEEYWGKALWPSREIAEQRALDDLEKGRRFVGHDVSEYLGARPVEGECP